jgi:hypothetical protein
MRLPIVYFDDAYHIGTLDDRPDAKRHSFEGACLSTSHEPGAWSRIARIGGPLWRLHKPGARFLDIHAIGRTRRRALLRYAVEIGLLQRVLLWRVAYFDDEMDDTLVSTYRTYAQAAAEAPESTRPVPQRSYETTALLTTRFGHRPQRGFLAEDWALLAIAEIHGLDGAWWNDDLDVSRYSAPRVGIFSRVLPTFARRHIAWRDTVVHPRIACGTLAALPLAQAQAALAERVA